MVKGLKGAALSFSKGAIQILELFKPATEASVILALRLWIAAIFWQAGLTKLDDWETTLFLFESEYMVHEIIPFLTPSISAYLATFGEICFPVLLLIGFGARLASIGILLMTLIIQLSYLQSVTHLVWALVALPIVVQGPGAFSVDFFIRRKMIGTPDSSREPWRILCALVTLVLITIAMHEIFLAADMAPDGWNSWVDVWQEFWTAGT